MNKQIKKMMKKIIKLNVYAYNWTPSTGFVEEIEEIVEEIEEIEEIPEWYTQSDKFETLNMVELSENTNIMVTNFKENN